MNSCLLSSNYDNYETPPDFFAALDSEFHFTLDPCCSFDTSKCPFFFTKDDDGLLKDWSGHTVFVNPPYGRQISKWIQKAYKESKTAKVVLLIPARTDTNYFHDYIYGRADIRFIRGRLNFLLGGVPSGRCPFPCMVVIYPDPVT